MQGWWCLHLHRGHGTFWVRRYISLLILTSVRTSGMIEVIPEWTAASAQLSSWRRFWKQLLKLDSQDLVSDFMNIWGETIYLFIFYSLLTWKEKKKCELFSPLAHSPKTCGRAGPRPAAWNPTWGFPVGVRSQVQVPITCCLPQCTLTGAGTGNRARLKPTHSDVVWTPQESS